MHNANLFININYVNYTKNWYEYTHMTLQNQRHEHKHIYPSITITYHDLPLAVMTD